MLTLQDMWCEARRTCGVRHAALQDVWFEAKSASRTGGVSKAGLQDVCCESRRTSGVKQNGRRDV